MSTEERLKGILERQAVAAERRREQTDEAERKRLEAADLKRRVLKAWEERKLDLERHLERINAAMGGKGQTVFLHNDARIDGHHAAAYKIDFNNHNYPNSHSMDNIRITVAPDGKTHFRVGTSSISPVKSYDKNILECTSDDMLEAILDFMDANTPKA